MTHFRLLLPALLFTACGTHSVIERSHSFARLGDFMHAYEVLEQARAEQAAGGGEVDKELAEAHGIARKEYLYDRARRHIFAEKEDKALADLEQLKLLEPAYPGADELRQRALYKKATRRVLRGDEHLLRKEFTEALACYGDSLSVLEGFPKAVDGIERVKQATASMTVRAHQQFLEAVRKLPEFRYIEVQWHAGNVIHNDPNNAAAKEIQAKAQRENALKAMARGKECEKKEQFGAALMEYREAQRLDRTLEDAPTGIQRMEREMTALGHVDRAQVEMRAQRFDTAREYLDKAFEVSELARPNISELMMQVKKREGEQRYQNARDLEVLGKKDEALVAFEAIAKDFPDGLQDEKARILGLKADLDGAGTEWAAGEAAEAAGDLAKALGHYKNAVRYHAGIKDGKERIQKLEAKIAAEPKPATPAATGGETPPAPPAPAQGEAQVQNGGNGGTPPAPAGTEPPRSEAPTGNGGR